MRHRLRIPKRPFPGLGAGRQGLSRWVLVVGLLCLTAAPALSQAPEVAVGSKAFTEGVLLGEITTQMIRQAGTEAIHRDQLGGTRFLWNALTGGDIDVYPEYTGTILQEILAGQPVTAEGLGDALAAHGVRMTRPLGFNNTYALGMRTDRAEALGIETIADLRAHPGLRFGFSNEFMDRGDGWPALRTAYALPHTNVRGLDHDLAYRGLEATSLDVIDLYSTDAEIAYYGLRVLADDRAHFPRYDAVILYRADLEARAPAAVAALHRLEGAFSEATVIGLNARAKLDKVPAAVVAADFVNATLAPGEAVVARTETLWTRLGRHTRAHLFLVVVSLFAAIVVAIPLGILAQKTAAGPIILSTVGVIYTIPSLALLVFMIPLLGIGGPPAMVALFLYSLLPIVRNTHAGLADLPGPLHESAEALGLTPGAKLRRIELPMASRAILAGIKTSAVINVGTATLGALIGAGGYGQPILTGIRLDDTGLILEGAIPAAVLALVVQGAFDLSERWLVPKGLRLSD